MSVKHLAAGSAEPPVSEGEIRLYSMRFCPYAHRAHLILNAKNIPYNAVYINLTNKPEWYLEKFPAGKVPSLLINGEFLYESLIIAEFLNELYPEPPLYPKDPLQKAKDKLVLENAVKITSPFYQTMMKEQFSEEDFNNLLKGLSEFEEELAKKNTPYFGGDKPGMVDYMLWPWFERIPTVEITYGDVGKIPKEKYPKLMNWRDSLINDNAVVKHYLNPEIHATHFRLRKENKPAFDIL